MYESSGSQFFRTTTGIQSGPDVFDESRFLMTFLTILGVTEILCSFRLVLEGKTGKEIPESSRSEFLEKNLKRFYSRCAFVENTSNSSKVPRAKFLGSDPYFCFICTSKFGSFKNPFATITSLPQIYFRYRRFSLLVQTK